MSNAAYIAWKLCLMNRGARLRVHPELTQHAALCSSPLLKILVLRGALQKSA